MLFTSQVTHMSKNEIVSEKIRAIIHRRKGRDIYDLWYLLTQHSSLDTNLISEKFKYYGETYQPNALIKRIQDFPKNVFINDLKPFVQLNERDKLSELFTYVIAFLESALV